MFELSGLYCRMFQIFSTLFLFVSKRIKNTNDLEFDNDLICFLGNGGHGVAVDVGAGCSS